MVCDIAFKAPTLTAAQYHAKWYPKQTYFYTFDYNGEISTTRNDSSPFGQGVLHADELMYLFPGSFKDGNLNEDDKKVSQQMVDLWTSFASDGIPKSDDAPNWPSLES